MAQNLPINRAKGVNAETAEHFYNIVHNKKSELEAKYGPIPASNWWNTDESGYCGDQGETIIMTRKGRFKTKLVFFIKHLNKYLSQPSIVCSLLIWDN